VAIRSIAINIDQMVRWFFKYAMSCVYTIRWIVHTFSFILASKWVMYIHLIQEADWILYDDDSD